jgi:hypothetical protein
MNTTLRFPDFVCVVSVVMALCLYPFVVEAQDGVTKSDNGFERIEVVGWVAIPNPGLASPILSVGEMRYTTILGDEVLNIYAPLHNPDEMLRYNPNQLGRFLAVAMREDEALFVYVLKWFSLGSESYTYRVASVGSLDELPPIPKRPFPAE